MISKHPMKWKEGNDSIAAKHVAKVVDKIESLGYEIFFWHETIKDGNVEDFYLQRIKDRI